MRPDGVHAVGIVSGRVQGLKDDAKIMTNFFILKKLTNFFILKKLTNFHEEKIL